jgi:RNA polymerase sigma factor for flagellar operon FliA
MNLEQKPVEALTREELVERYRPLVESVARSLQAQFDGMLPLEDLRSYGYAGLIEAHGRFDPSRGTKFGTFAYYRIRGSMLDGCRRESWLPDRASKVEAASLGSINTHLESAASVATSTPAASSFSDSVGALSELVSGAATLARLHEDVAQATASTAVEDAFVERIYQRQVFEQMFKVLSNRELEVLVRLHLLGQSTGQVVETMGYSKSWVSRLAANAVHKLQRHLSEMDSGED